MSAGKGDDQPQAELDEELSGDFVCVTRLYDTTQAALTRDLLEQAGIPCAMPGTMHRAIEGGLIAGFIHIPVDVPREHAEEARELHLAALRHERDALAQACQRNPSERTRACEKYRSFIYRHGGRGAASP